MRIEVFSKDTLIFNSPHVQSINLITEKGETTLLESHVNMLVKIEPCDIKIKYEDSKHESISVLGGFLYIKRNIVNILVQTKEEEISKTETNLHEQAIKNAYDLVNEAQTKTNYDYAFIIGELQRELLKIRRSL